MLFVTNEEVVFLNADGGEMTNDDGVKFDWTKITFADPKTYENHQLAYKKSLHDKLQGFNKGQRVIIKVELEPTKNKSRAILADIDLVK